ncbi:nucleotidyltransferase domain-containing protein [Actinoplanes sp. NPDC051513]|uniref:nucleotidyltransferase domain-containing protein n=1 Tax=Actinoplanes sp. NPDC051513 TaxID=3363908 RepID=UPI0037B55485
MIDTVTRDYLAAADAALPGFVEGFYLVGSVAVGAYQQGRSDIDAMIFTSRPASADDLAVLRDLHAKVAVDGVYLEPALARTWPTDRPVAPFVVDGDLRAGQPCGELTPVVWLILQRYGIALRGPAVADLGVRVDPDEVRRYNLDNLREYWQANAHNFRSYVEALPAGEARDATIVAWYVLGPARLHHTAATGGIISKIEAGPYLASLFPEYAELAGRAVRHRAGEDVAFRTTDLLMAFDAVDAVAEDAWRRFGHPDGTT